MACRIAPSAQRMVSPSEREVQLRKELLRERKRSSTYKRRCDEAKLELQDLQQEHAALRSLYQHLLRESITSGNSTARDIIPNWSPSSSISEDDEEEDEDVRDITVRASALMYDTPAVPERMISRPARRYVVSAQRRPAASRPVEESSAQLARRLQEEEYRSHASHMRQIALARRRADDIIAQAERRSVELRRQYPQTRSHANSEELNYEQMLRLGEENGDVARERWMQRARGEIERLNVCVWDTAQANGDEACVVCQCDLEDNDHVRTLPCEHVFHRDCVDPWLLENNSCPLCKRTIDN